MARNRSGGNRRICAPRPIACAGRQYRSAGADTARTDEAKRGDEKTALQQQPETVMKFVDEAPHPRGANPLLWPVSGLAKAPLPLPRRVISRPVVAWLRGLARIHGSRLCTACAMPSLTVAGAAQVGPLFRRWAPCFPFNCVHRNAHTSTKVPGSLGRQAQRVKETPGRLWPMPVISYARVWCQHVRSHVQLNGKQEARQRPLNLCSPATVSNMWHRMTQHPCGRAYAARCPLSRRPAMTWFAPCAPR